MDAAPKLAEWIDGILADTGAIPHAALPMNLRGSAKVAIKAGGGIAAAPAADDDDEPSDAPISSRPKPQTGRLLKA
ncbi:hypothetical protein ACFQ4Q_07290 [Lysobacter gummosus]|uniref:hypothetical protein n=1 Tax=Lysobacter gummosus TaxID=262324 RepID=UPI0036327C69